MHKLLLPSKFSEYSLIDSGNGMKLERFGNYTLIRPEPQALWSPQLEMKEWESVAHARYVDEESHHGRWEQLKKISVPWQIKYKSPHFALTFELHFTQFKHIGIFPEQSSHWDFIYDQCRRLNNPKVLNLFAYTGGSTLAAKAGGADVIHLDSVKGVINWASRNMELSKLKDVRWVVEDALRFVHREVRRGNQYQGIIMDPPSYGLGPKGERWRLEDKINELLQLVSKLLVPNSFLVFNTYSLNISPYVLKTLVESHFGAIKNCEIGELAVKSSDIQVLPLGSYLRFGV